MRVLLVMACMTLVGNASADTWARQNGYGSLGTAYRPAASVNVNVVSASTVSATSVVDTQNSSVMRVNCDVSAGMKIAKGTIDADSATSVRVDAGIPEYFVALPGEAPGFRAFGDSGVCNVTRMSK